MELPHPAQILTPIPVGIVGQPDLREQFNHFLEANGQMVLVQRLNLKIHCTQCWNAEYGEGDPQCPYCLGRGYLSILERHVSRKMSSLNEHRQQILTQSAPGVELVDEVFWYFEYDVNIAEEDIVFEVSWQDAAMTEPQKLLTSYRVEYAFPFRAEHGRLIYWRGACSARPVDRDIVGDHLRRIAPQVMQIADDGVLRYAATYRSSQ
jgi:hypothetical protein